MKNKKIVIGIQGDRGSFNEQAALRYITKHHIDNYQLAYLFTTGRVLGYLNNGKIDLGIFAIHNAKGGFVKESITALYKYNCKLRDTISIIVRHFLMKREDNNAKKPGVIMAHEQVFLQCKRTLNRRYPRARRMTGKGILKDTAHAARALGAGKLPKTTFILGPQPLARLYGLTIIDRDLQDTKNNKTTFFVVSKE